MTDKTQIIGFVFP